MKKNELFKYTIITILICILLFIIPLLIVNRYLNVNNTGALGVTFKDLYESNLTNDQKTTLTILRNACNSNLIIMKKGFQLMFMYFVTLISMILLISGVSLMKEQPVRFKVYLCLFFALIIGVIIFTLFFPSMLQATFRLY